MLAKEAQRLLGTRKIEQHHKVSLAWHYHKKTRCCELSVGNKSPLFQNPACLHFLGCHTVFQLQLQVLWQTQILQPHIIPLYAAMAPHGLKVSSPHTHPLCFTAGWGSRGEDAVTGTLSLQFQSEKAVMQYHRLQVFPLGELASETLHSQLDIDIYCACLVYTTTPAT